MTDATNTHIRTVDKNAVEEFRCAVTEYKGREYIDLRVYAAYQGDADRKATRKGVTIAPDRLDGIIDALTEARAECERRGLLPVGCPSTRYAEGMTR